MMREAVLYEAAEGRKLHCYLCNHHCRIADSKFGFCGVRQNRGGRLYTHAYGEVIAVHIDPIEKKPLYHFLPGTSSLSVGTIGCNFRCGFCQNWQISQTAKGGRSTAGGYRLFPEEIVTQAEERRCASIAYTYTEPTIFFEYAYDTAKLAKERRLGNVFVTNGYMTPAALETIRPYLDACNVDLKSFRDEFYRETCRGRLEPVLESIRLMKRLNIWVEITTLVIPGLNDDETELGDIAGFIAGVDPHIPWHITRFHPDYELRDAQATPVERLDKAFALGRKAGLHHVYKGNVALETAQTHCASCRALLVRRKGFSVLENRLKGSNCPDCGESPLPGCL